ncbi:OadG family transporter subunit [Actomonas aquatica]|uniref:Uncharacterized protein n=1 Tax=Actomonas aquatica TaxID=2866162 RepID=A0ABZ1CF95_9BACT|nr:OadG family transporter subunit [Opitutus sp. WL0086]WRQ90077.1 hypothetical protein K1X11_011715 [Opitutus sp. WL0086]
MTPLLLAFNWQNIVDGDGIPLAITGISIVFGGLVLIAAYITVLPRVLERWDAWRSKGQPADAAAAGAEEDDGLPSPEVRAALAWVALRELEVFRLGDQTRLTFKPVRSAGLWSILNTSRYNDPAAPCADTNSSSTTNP